MRVRLLNEIHKCGISKKPCYLNLLAAKVAMSHVAVKKHLELMVDEGYVMEINPDGKPVYLELADKGKDLLKEFKR